MKIAFHTGNVRLHDAVRAHYQGAISHLQTLLGRLHGDDDTTEVLIRMNKNKHHSGERFEVSAHLKSKKLDAHASTKEQNLDKGAHNLYEKLKRQVIKHHSKAMAV